ncbi:MAG: zinc-ribbon domain-containing protein [Chloroflexi bacterium]|nr:zinc-ribbon domain-containing protein [Chloroflexota bacterium]
MILFILFGVRTRTRTVDTGQFYCPYENAQRPYERKAARLWFTLYFIPLIPLNKQGDFIECQSCHRSFNAGVLDPAWQQRMKQKASGKPVEAVSLVNSLKQHLENGMPIEYAVRDLTTAGFERQVVMQMIEAQIGKERKYCHNCGLTYAPRVKRCQECNEATM